MECNTMEMIKESEDVKVLKYTPAVFVVGDTYQIMVRVNCSCVMWVKIGEQCYYDESNGIMRSGKSIHRMTVPAQALNETGEYTVCYRKMIERKVYYTQTSDIYEEKFDFYPVTGEKIAVYHISDAHNLIEEPVAAMRTYEAARGKIDALILNGDVHEHSGRLENIDNVYRVIEAITGGTLPVVFSRGNHDTRGMCAENLEDYTPVENGRSYYTFRLGNIWGMVLDTGEDKWDDDASYGNAACFHGFRERETEYIRQIIENAEREYLAEDVTYRIIVVHNPFTRKWEPYPFDVDEDIFVEWAKLLKEFVKPDIMLCGHEHNCSLDWPGGIHDNFGQPCPVAVGTVVEAREHYFAGAGFVFEGKHIEVIFNDKDKILERHIVRI